MKRTGKQLKLKRQLTFVRTTVRGLTPKELETAHAAGYTDNCYAHSGGCCTPDYTD